MDMQINQERLKERIERINEMSRICRYCKEA